MKEKNNLLIPSALLAAGLVLSVIIFSLVWKSARSSDQTITVTGSAKKEITSDFGIQRGTLQTSGYDGISAFQSIKQKMPVLLNFLKSKGFSEDQIEFFTINSYAVYQIGPNGVQTQNVSHYVYTQRFEVRSADVNKIKELSISLSAVVEKGVDVSVDMPEYFYSKIDDLKIEIQAEAAKNAMERAAKIAASTGRDLGPLRNARMGVIQIAPKNSNMVSDYGINDVSSIVKEITAVVSASFQIN